MANFHGVISLTHRKADLSSDETQIIHFKKTALQVLQGFDKSAQTEMLKGTRLVCARASGAERILFSNIRLDGRAYLVFVDYIDNHRYDKSQFKDAASVQALLDSIQLDYGRDNDAFIQTHVFTEGEFLSKEESKEKEGNEKGVLDTPELDVLTCYGGSFICLTEEQADVRELGLPLIVSGVSGGGKSCIAMNRLVDLASDDAADDDKHLYITQSKTLARRMQTMWGDNPEVSHCQDKVVFIDYQSFISQYFLEALQCWTIVGKHTFYDWYSAQAKKLGLTIKAEVVYQEFQSMAVCETVDEYLNIGKKNTLITDEKIKRKVYSLFQLYQKYLQSSQFIDIKFFQPAQTIHPTWGSVMVDEAQDFSPAQLNLLRHLAHNWQHCFFIDTNQSIKEVLSVRPHLLNMHNNKITQVDLKISYRCHPNIVAVANCAQRMKNVVLGGKGDQAEYIELKSALLASEPSTVKWINLQQHKETKQEEVRQEALKEAAKQTIAADCAVVIPSESMRADVKKHFNTPLTFTVEEIKGLEYDKVILYRMLEVAAFAEIDKLLPDELEKEGLKVHRPKSEANMPYLIPFALLYTAITRAKRSLYVVETESHEHKVLCKHLRASIEATARPEASTNNSTSAATEPKAEEPAKTSKEDWEAQARYLIENNLLQQARETMEQKLGIRTKGLKKATVEGLISLLDDEAISANASASASSSSSSNSNSNSNSSSQAKTSAASSNAKRMHPRDKKGTNQTPPKNKKGQNQKLWAAGNGAKGLKPAQQIPAADSKQDKSRKYVDVFLKNVKGNLPALVCETNDKQFKRYFFKVKSSSRKTIYEVLCKRQLLGLAVAHMAKQRQFLFMRILVENAQLIKNEMLDAFFEPSMFYFLCACAVTFPILQRILRNHAKCYKKITAEALCTITSPPGGDAYDAADISQNATPLCCLSPSPEGQAILKTLLGLNHRLTSHEQFAQALFRPVGVRNHQNTSSLYWLSAITTGRPCLKKILAQNPRLASHEQFAQALFRTISAGPDQNNSPLHRLCDDDAGVEILKTVLELNPGLASHDQFAQALCRVVTREVYYQHKKFSAYSKLIESTQGRALLQQMIHLNPELEAQLSQYAKLGETLPADLRKQERTEKEKPRESSNSSSNSSSSVKAVVGSARAIARLGAVANAPSSSSSSTQNDLTPDCNTDEGQDKTVVKLGESMSNLLSSSSSNGSQGDRKHPVSAAIDLPSSESAGSEKDDKKQPEKQPEKPYEKDEGLRLQ